MVLLLFRSLGMVDSCCIYSTPTSRHVNFNLLHCHKLHLNIVCVYHVLLSLIYVLVRKSELCIYLYKIIVISKIHFLKKASNMAPSFLTHTRGKSEQCEILNFINNYIIA